MRVAVVDDELRCLEEMKGLLESFGRENGVRLETAVFTSGEAFLQSAARERYALVFLDIYMEGLSGLEAAARLREWDKQSMLIFLTGSGDHHPEAFTVHAFEYILKPYTRERVNAVLRDAMAVLPGTQRYIEVVSERRTVRVYLEEIVSVVTDAHYVEMRLLDDRVVRSRMTMQEFLRMTAGEPGLILVNKGIVLNADYIVGFEDTCCVTEDGARYPVRVRDRLKIEQAARDYHFGKIRSLQRRGTGERK